VNASPLIFLARLGLLDILNEAGVAVKVPDAVLSELSANTAIDSAAVAVRSAGWIGIVPAPPVPARLGPWNLGAGETSVLAVAIAEVESGGARAPEIDVVLDDVKARRCAASVGLRVQGTLALLLIAKQTGRIDAVRPHLERLQASGMYVSAELMARILSQAGE
jgi:predicted nucleic acid-binding protein